MCFTMKEQHSWLHINAVTFITQVPFTSIQIPGHAPCLLSQKENLLQCLDNLVKKYNCSNPLKIWCKLHTGKSETISVQIKLWFSRDITQHPKESISQQHFHAHAVSLYKMPNHRITINGKFQIWEHTANTQKKNWTNRVYPCTHLHNHFWNKHFLKQVPILSLVESTSSKELPSRTDMFKEELVRLPVRQAPNQTRTTAQKYHK